MVERKRMNGTPPRTRTNHEHPRIKVDSKEEAEFALSVFAAAPDIPDEPMVYPVARVCVRGMDSYIETTDYEMYRLPRELIHWARATVLHGQARFLTFPMDIEFGREGGRFYAEMK